MLVLVDPVLQVYVVAPEALSTTVWPAHTAALPPLMLTVGVAPGVTVCVAPALQPLLPVPFTVYVVATAGETVILLLVEPVLQV